jgi:hypothetical protein
LRDIKETTDKWTTQSILNSINTKLAIIVSIIVIGLLSNGYRTVVDSETRRQAVIIERMQKRITELREQKESCESGTPMPLLKD